MGSCGENQIPNQEHTDYFILYTTGTGIREYNQPVRYLLNICDIQWKEEVVQDLKEFREKFDLCSELPACEKGNIRLNYAIPIVNYILHLSKNCSLIGKSTVQASENYDLLMNVYDLMQKVHELNYDPLIKQRMISFQAEFEPQFESLLDTTKGNTYLNRREKVSVADLFFHELTYWMLNILAIEKQSILDLVQSYQHKFRTNMFSKNMLQAKQFFEFGAHWTGK